MKEDLIGRRFNHWTVIDVGERDSNGRFRWLCRCDCGRTANVYAFSLNSNKSKSCGCGLGGGECLFKDITNQRFGRLVVIEQAEEKDKSNGAIWRCKCDCGNTINVLGAKLRNGKIKSCGCVRKEKLSLIDRTKISHKKHGAFDKYGNGERLYHIWDGMKQRCYNPKNPAYKYYGGRGIRICAEWISDYSVFREWAFANGYDPNAKRGDCTIDRIDNDKGYEPSNCRWVDMKIQSQNKRCGKYPKAGE